MSDPVASVREGKVRGKVARDLVGNDFYSFQGIPYAKPPLGKLRFKAPEPPEKWEGIRDATRDGHECYVKGNTYSRSEDCLVINVFTKEIQGKVLRPVMFWIHGGGFTTGSSHSVVYGAEYLITQDVVLVTFNYRLGVLGFLSFEDSSLGVPGNAGLKDMVMALKWVQNNIREFSGDPDNVTIFGESAGAVSVQLLMVSPMSKGLFHKAIAQSGCASNIWARGKRTAVYELANALGIESNNEEIILDELQQLTIQELHSGACKVVDSSSRRIQRSTISGSMDLTLTVREISRVDCTLRIMSGSRMFNHDILTTLFYIGKIRPFGPVIEKESTESSFLSEDPVHLIKSGRYQKVPLIMGYVSHEGMLVYGLCKTVKGNHLLVDETIVPYTMNLRIGSSRYNTMVNTIKNFYFSGRDPLENKDDIFRLYTDNYFLVELYNTARQLIETGNSPTYFYRFSLDTSLNFMKSVFSISDPGTCHADEFSYLFKNGFAPEDIEPGSTEYTGIQRMIKLWTNFAKYGNPNPNTKDELLPVAWQPLDDQKFNYLEIGEDLEMRVDPEKEAINFWNDLYLKNSLSKAKL